VTASEALGGSPLVATTKRPPAWPLRTLVVDDDPVSREMLSRILHRHGHEAVPAESAEEALDLFRANTPDLVLMDVVLPGMDGCEAMQIMKRERQHRVLPVILVSVKDTCDQILDGLRAGADDYLTKPFQIDHVVAKLRNVSSTLLLQRQLESSLKFARVIMDHIGEALICCDEHGAIQASNQAAEQLFAFPPGELLGVGIGQLLPDTPRSVRPLPGTSGPIYGAGCRRNGEIFSLDARQTLVTIDGRAITVYTIRDVTQRLDDERRMLNDAAKLREYKEERESENAFAREMLGRLLYQGDDRVRNFRYFMDAAAGFSGDAVAAVRAPDGRLFVMLADATGHGLAAAISLVPALSVLYAMVGRSCKLLDIVRELNRKMLELMPVGRFLAAAVVCLNERERTGEVWVGGAPAVLLVSETGELVERFRSEHFALGIVPADPSTEGTISFSWSPGAHLVFTSDGVVEAENILGEPFGEVRLLDALARSESARYLDAVSRALRDHLGGIPNTDDASLAIVDLS
jgi:two-component system, HptB-dependent secretion and biofilm response regulator